MEKPATTPAHTTAPTAATAKANAMALAPCAATAELMHETDRGQHSLVCLTILLAIFSPETGCCSGEDGTTTLYVLRAWVRRDDDDIELDDDDDENPYIYPKMLRNLLHRANQNCGECIALPDDDDKSGILAARLCDPSNPETIKFNVYSIMNARETCCSGWNRYQLVEDFDEKEFNESEEYIEEKVIVVTDPLERGKGAHIYMPRFTRCDM